MSYFKTSTSVLFLWLLAGGVAVAADDPAKLEECTRTDAQTALTPAQRLAALIARDCLRLDAFTPEDLRPARDLLGSEVKPEEIPSRALRVVGDLIAEISAEAAARSGLEGTFFGEMVDRALRARRALAEGVEGERYLLAEEWRLHSDGLVGSEAGIAIDPFLASCPNDPADPEWDANDCTPRYRTARDVLVRTRLMERTLDDANRPALIAAAKANQLALDRWDAYFNDTRSQYLWELVVNQCRLNRNDGRPEVDGIKLGFREVPTSQVIVLHPGVAYEYLDDAADGSQFEETAILEVVGFNRWQWDGSDAKKAWGLSLTAAWTDREGSDDFGYGLMLHLAHRFSIGVTDHDGDVGVLVSADVSKLWLKVQESRRKLFRGDD